MYLDLSFPVVMGVMNITDDSFYDGGRYLSESAVHRRIETMIEEGAAIIDIGAVSTRPGSSAIPAEYEIAILQPVIQWIEKNYPDILISVDTFRSQVALAAAESGAHIINDISGGTMDDRMAGTMAGMDLAYVMMHIQGTPETMQINPVYEDVTREVMQFFDRQLEKFTVTGKSNIILDPGFGFGKTIAHNYELLGNLGAFSRYPYPVLAGLSRKSLIYRSLNITPDEALNGTTVLNTIALLNGANILRVHDVKQAVETIKLIKILKESNRNN